MNEMSVFHILINGTQFKSVHIKFRNINVIVHQLILVL